MLRQIEMLILIHFPSVIARRTEEECGHRLIRRAHLFLCRLDFFRFAFEACKLSFLNFAIFLVEIALKSIGSKNQYYACIDHSFPAWIFFFVSSSASSLASRVAKSSVDISPKTMFTFRYGLPLSLRIRILSLTFAR